MFLLRKSILDPNLYTIGAIDSPSTGSETDMYKNITESANILDPFEVVYKKAVSNLHAKGYTFDEQEATLLLKDYYQHIRHGMSFDWVMNYVMVLIRNVFPFTHYPEFKGTQPFIEYFKDDPVFIDEITRLQTDLTPILDGVFGTEDKTVFARLAKDSGTTNFQDAVNWAKMNSKEDLYPFSIDLLPRTNYLVLLSEMLYLSIGPFKRSYWTDHLKSIYEQFPVSADDVVVTGSHFNCFAFGNIDGTGPKWHKFTQGIKLADSHRTHRKEYIRAFPDEMTFFRFDAASSTLFVDETYFPMVSINLGDWIHAKDFQNVAHDFALDAPLSLRLRYRFPQDPKVTKLIKLRAGVNCVIKDNLVALDADGVGETQIVFRSSTASFKISDPDKKYPFAFFNTKDAGTPTSFAWLP